MKSLKDTINESFTNESKKVKTVKTTIDKFFTWYMGDKKWYDDWQTTNTMLVNNKHAQDDGKDGKTWLEALKKDRNQEISIDISDLGNVYVNDFTHKRNEYNIDSVEVFD